jgi:hypothetical protein
MNRGKNETGAFFLLDPLLKSLSLHNLTSTGVRNGLSSPYIALPAHRLSGSDVDKESSASSLYPFSHKT